MSTAASSRRRWTLAAGLGAVLVVTVVLGRSKGMYDAHAQGSTPASAFSAPAGQAVECVLPEGGKPPVNDHDRNWAFANIYDTNEWSSTESKSGKGSEMRYTERVRGLLDRVIEQYNVKSLADAPCGDFAWQWALKNFAHINYTGMDIVPFVIQGDAKKNSHLLNARFINLDLVLDNLPNADAYMVRDVVQHLSLEDGAAVLKNVERTSATYLITNFHVMKGTGEPVPNRNIEAGQFYPNHVMLPPFNFPPPIMYTLDMHDGYFEREKDDMGIKMVGLWKLPAFGRGDGNGFNVDLQRAREIVEYEESSTTW